MHHLLGGAGQGEHLGGLALRFETNVEINAGGVVEMDILDTLIGHLDQGGESGNFHHTSVKLARELGKIAFSTGKPKLTQGEVPTFQGF